MKTYICTQCKSEFITRKRPDRIIKFCSRNCCYLSKKGKSSWNKGIPMRESTKLIQSNQRKGKHFSPQTEFVSQQTAGAKNFRWKNGKWITSQGYIHILLPTHPRANIRGYVPEQVLISEQYLGHHLSQDEVVHHINEVKTDNCPENLYVFPNKTEHARHHMNLLRGKEQRKQSNLH